MINNDLLTDQYRPSRIVQKSSHNRSLDVEAAFATLNSLSEGMIITDIEGKFLFFNPVAIEILGIGIKNIPPEKWTSVYGCYYPDKLTPYPPEKLPLALAINGESIHDARIFIRNSEKPEGVYISVDANPIWNTQGSIIGGSVIIRDISKNIQYELSLLESQERLRIQFNGFPQPTYVWQKSEDDFILIDYNHAAKRFNQGSIGKHIGTKLSKMHGDSPEILADFKECFEKKSSLHRAMTYTTKKNNKIRNWIVNYVFLPPDLIMAHTEDITEKINNEKELLKLSSAVMQTADSVLLTDKHGIIEYVNPAFEKTTGYTMVEVIGKTPALLKSGKHESEFYKNLWEIILSGSSYTGTIMNKKKDGSLYWCQQSITPMKDNNGNISNFVSVIKDISELKKKQEQDFYLRIASEVQQRLSKTKFSLPGFDIAGASYSALETSGDYFDFIRTAEGHGLLVVGDVCGHGVGAALIMAETRAYIRAFAKVESDPAKILIMLNEELNSDLDEHHYVTLILARIDPVRNILDYASAGHIPAYLLNSAGEIVNVLGSTGIPLGYMSGEEYTQSKPISLKSGTILALITDGVTEALSKDENQFGHDRMINFINRNRNDSAQQITNNLIKAVCLFTDLPHQEDDITAVVCKIN